MNKCSIGQTLVSKKSALSSLALPYPKCFHQYFPPNCISVGHFLLIILPLSLPSHVLLPIFFTYRKCLQQISTKIVLSSFIKTRHISFMEARQGIPDKRINIQACNVVKDNPCSYLRSSMRRYRSITFTYVQKAQFQPPCMLSSCQSLGAPMGPGQLI